MFGFLGQIIDLASSDVPFVGLGFFPVVVAVALVVCFGILVDQKFWAKKRQFQQIFGLAANLPEQDLVGRRVAYVIKHRQVAAQDAETRMTRLESELNRASIEDDNLSNVRERISELRVAQENNDYLQDRFQTACDVARWFDFDLTLGSDSIWVTRFGLNIGVA